MPLNLESQNMKSTQRPARVAVYKVERSLFKRNKLVGSLHQEVLVFDDPKVQVCFGPPGKSDRIFISRII